MAGASVAVAFAVGLVRAVRPRLKPPVAGTASWPPPAERPDPPPRQGPVRFKDQTVPADEPPPKESSSQETPPLPKKPSSQEASAFAASQKNTATGATLWAAPIDGQCPDGYPVKAAAGSRIFHVPGGAFYERTVPERCYATPADAVADGLRAAKR